MHLPAAVMERALAGDRDGLRRRWSAAVLTVVVVLALGALAPASSAARAAAVQWSGYVHTPGLGSDGEGVVTDAAGNAYFAGSIGVAAGDSDWRIFKTNRAGHHAWDLTWGGAGKYDSAVAIVLDRARGMLYVAGVVQDGAGVSRLATMAVTTGGVKRWVKTYAAPSGQEFDWLQGLGLDRRGNIYVGAAAYDRAASTYTRGYVLKYARTGKLVWSRGWAPPDSRFVLSALAVAPSGVVAVTGSDGGDAATRDAWTAELTARGKLAWAQRWTGPGGNFDSGFAAAFGPRGSLYVGGVTYSAATRNDALLLKYSAKGALVWQATKDGGASLDDSVHYLAVDKAGRAYAGGYGHHAPVTVSDAMLTPGYSAAGAFRWEQWVDPPVANRGAEVESLQLSGGRVYVAGKVQLQDYAQWEGRIASYQTGTGAPAWTLAYSGEPAAPWGACWLNALAVDGTRGVYVAGSAQRPYGGDPLTWDGYLLRVGH